MVPFPETQRVLQSPATTTKVAKGLLGLVETESNATGLNHAPDAEPAVIIDSSVFIKHNYYQRICFHQTYRITGINHRDRLDLCCLLRMAAVANAILDV